MKLRPEEITQILKSRIEQYDVETDLSEVGTVLQVGDGIARIYGLENAVASEMLEFEHDVIGLAFNLEEDDVGAALFGEWQFVSEGEPVRRTGRVASVPVGEALLGRVVDPLGNPLDGQGPIDTDETRPLEFKAPGVIARQPVKEPLQTGIKAIDSMTNVGRGQRELIIGDRSTGKTAICDRHDPEPARPGREVLLRRRSARRRRRSCRCTSGCKEAGAMAYTTIVSAPAHEAAPIKWMAPFAGCAMGEYFLYKGEHALVIYDDLSKHADAYRQLSLLLRRPPGREAFPGDVFYLHSRLLERAAKLSDELGGGSLTALPIIETQAGDIAAYIPTNVISITDGQIFLQSDLFFSGVRPAVNVGTSVSRVGSSRADEGDEEGRRPPAPRPRAVPRAGGVRAVRLGARQGDAGRALARGERMVATLNQPQYSPWPMEEQVVALFAGNEGYLDKIPVAAGAALPGGAARAPARRRNDLQGDPRDRRPRRGDREEAARGARQVHEHASTSRKKRRSSHSHRPGTAAARPRDHEHAQADEGDGARRLRAPAARAGADRGDASVRRPHARADGGHRARERVRARPAAAAASRRRTAAIVPVTGDRGLAGAFNAQILRRATALAPRAPAGRASRRAGFPSGARASRRCASRASSSTASGAASATTRTTSTRRRSRTGWPSCTSTGTSTASCSSTTTSSRRSSSS